MSKQQLPQNEKVTQSIPSYAYYRDDTISLIYLAKILINRRNLLFGTFIVVFSAALVAAWFKRPQLVADDGRVAFTTLFSVGYKSPTVFIEPLSSIKTQLESAFIPAASQDGLFNASVQVEYRRNVSEDGNNIVKLITVADKEKQQQVIDYHQEILQPLLLRHSRLDNELVKRQMLSFGRNNIDLQPIGSSIAAIAQPLPISSGGARNYSTMIVIFGFFLAWLLAVICAFIREFFSHVCNSLDSEKQIK